MCLPIQPCEMSILLLWCTVYTFKWVLRRKGCFTPIHRRPATPAFSHPFMRWRSPSLLVKWLYRLTSQVACKGFKTDNLRSTSMSSSFPIISNYRSVLNFACLIFAYPNFSKSLISRFFTNRENREIKASRKLVRIRYLATFYL